MPCWHVHGSSKFQRNFRHAAVQIELVSPRCMCSANTTPVTGAEPMLGGSTLRRMRLARALHPCRSFAARVRKVRRASWVLVFVNHYRHRLHLGSHFGSRPCKGFPLLSVMGLTGAVQSHHDHRLHRHHRRRDTGP